MPESRDLGKNAVREERAEQFPAFYALRDYVVGRCDIYLSL